MERETIVQDGERWRGKERECLDGLKVKARVDGVNEFRSGEQG